MATPLDTGSISSSSFYEFGETSIDKQFSDLVDLPSPHEHFIIKRANIFGQWWVLKGVNPKCGDTALATQLLKREYERCSVLWHPSIVRMIAMREVDRMQGLCIIEEWVDGITLNEFLATKPATEERTKIASQLVDAVSYYTDKGVVHGNLNPHNVLITRNGNNLKITDFYPENENNSPQDDIKSLGVLLQSLSLPRKYKSFVKQCLARKWKNGSELKHGYEQCLHGKNKMWSVAAIIVALAALATAAFMGGYNKKIDDTTAIPTGYRVAPQGDNDKEFFSTISNTSFFYVHPGILNPYRIADDEAVDLGLSVKWARSNLGAPTSAINNTGGYYMWSDTVGEQMPDYFIQQPPLPDIAGNASYDIARAKLGGRWKMPTAAQMEELINKCNWQWITPPHSPQGYLVTGPNGNSIFLPCGGCSDKGIRMQDLGEEGYYWTSTAAHASNPIAYSLKFSENNINIDNTTGLYVRMNIRPVMDK